MLMAVSSVVVLVLLVGLVLVVRQLQGQVRDLTTQVTALSALTAPSSSPAPADKHPLRTGPDPKPTPASTSTPTPTTRSEPVPVITRIADRSYDDLDLTAARVASVTLARPLITVAAWSHGLRRALGDEQRSRVRYTVHRELRRQRKLRRRRRAAQGPAKGWRP